MELNILLRGQSNAVFFDTLGGQAAVAAEVDKLLGFDGVTNRVNIVGGATPDANGNATAYGATSLLPPYPNSWLNLVNGDYRQGFTPGTDEMHLLNAIADLPADQRAAPTAIIYMHDEADAAIAGGESTAEWTAALRYDAGLVRAALGQDAATTPYEFVPVPFDSDDAATMQAIRLGEEQLAADPTFNAAIATHTGDLNMDNPFNGLAPGQVIFGGPHVSQADVDILAARIAPSVADIFARYALPGSPIEVAGGRVDDAGPQAVHADLIASAPNQLVVALQSDPSAYGVQPLGAAAATGLGWTIRDGNTSVSASSAQILPGSQLLLTFDAAVPTDATARLFYGYGTGRLAPGADTHTGAGYPGVGPGAPGEGNGIYDANGLPVWASASGVAIVEASSPVVLPGAHTDYEFAPDGKAALIWNKSDVNGAPLFEPGLQYYEFSDGDAVFDATGTADLTTQLYLAATGVLPGAAALTDSVRALQNGSLTLPNLVDTLMAGSPALAASAPDDQFVAQLYENALGREPDATGFAGWQDILGQGASRGSVLLGFAQSEEAGLHHASTVGNSATAQLTRLFNADFGRDPTANEMQMYYSQAATDPHGLAVQFGGTPEYAIDHPNQTAVQFVDGLYASILGRQADSVGEANWVNNLQSGNITRADASLGFANSIEGRRDTSQAAPDGLVWLPR